MPDSLLTLLVLATLGIPTASFLLIAGWIFATRAPSERFIARIAAFTFISTLATSCAIAVTALRAPAPIVLPLGRFFTLGTYTFELNFVLDGLSVAMLLLTASICGLVGRFSVYYLHREPGFARFFALLFLFTAAMSFLVLSGGLDQLFLGWELVGFTSWLLITFFWHRASPVRHGLRTFITYRVCDTGLLLGAALLHHFAHDANLHEAIGATHYPIITGHVAPWQATLVSLCLLFAAMGKSAQFPFSGWLPRAMEGPTPSSALFYGALSVHAGAYLLLRAEPLLHSAPWARVAIVVVGILTAASATFSARVQSDVKGALGYAVITQMGLIFVEIGLGFTQLALAHIVAHAILRTLQLLRAPSALAAAREIQALSGGSQFETGRYYKRTLPQRVQSLVYRAALERFYLDTILERFVVAPVVHVAERLERFEQRWCAFQCHSELESGPSLTESTLMESAPRAEPHQETP